jgi:hypothetical protein
MIVCPNCGNKRCPHALNHAYRCTRSNDLGQVGEVGPETTPAFQAAADIEAITPIAVGPKPLYSAGHYVIPAAGKGGLFDSEASIQDSVGNEVALVDEARPGTAQFLADCLAARGGDLHALTRVCETIGKAVVVKAAEAADDDADRTGEYPALPDVGYEVLGGESGGA